VLSMIRAGQVTAGLPSFLDRCDEPFFNRRQVLCRRDPFSRLPGPGWKGSWCNRLLTTTITWRERFTRSRAREKHYQENCPADGFAGQVMVFSACKSQPTGTRVAERTTDERRRCFPSPGRSRPHPHHNERKHPRSGTRDLNRSLRPIAESRPASARRKVLPA